MSVERPECGEVSPAHPYLNWAIATNFAYLRPGDWIPLLVEIDQKVMRSEFIGLEWLHEAHRDDVRIAKLFGEPLSEALESLGVTLRHYVILIRRTRAAAVVAASGWNQTIRRAEMGPPMPPEAASEGPPLEAPLISTPDPTLPGPRVLIAVIDEGIAFAHQRFGIVSGAGNMQTRIRYVWQQDSSELTAAQIDSAVAQANALGAGEEAVYRSVGGLRMDAEGYKPLARRRSHGTNVLDLAAGFDPTAAAAKKRPILVVDMPESAVGDPAATTLTVNAYWGLFYILMRAWSMRAPDEVLPVVVNISYGPHEGPHDGTSMLEEFMDCLVQQTPAWGIPMQIVLAAGNYRQSRTHASFTLGLPSEERPLQWRLQPCAMTPSCMEIWLNPIAGATVEVTLKAPDGRQFAVSNLSPSAGEADATISVQYAPAGTYSKLRSVVLLFVAPTAVDPWVEPANLTVPSGLWTVTIKNTSQTSIDVDAWIKRSDTPGGRRAKGRQSYFDDPSYQRFDANGRPTEFDTGTSIVKRQGTLSGIATGQYTKVIGAFQRKATPCAWMPAIYSSEASPTMKAPDWLAPGDDSTACPGTLGAGTRSGFRISMNGTSAAAPQAARYYADQAGQPPPIPPASVLVPVSNRVPIADRTWVAGAGLMDVRPPLDRVWGDNRP